MVEPVALRYIVSSMHAVAWAGMACMLLRHRVVAQPSPEPQAVTISDTLHHTEHGQSGKDLAIFQCAARSFVANFEL